MNERIKELAELAGFNLGRFDVGSASLLPQRIEHFAELVRQDERELCAKLCDDASLYFIDQGMNAVDGADYCANEIRGRTE